MVQNVRWWDLRVAAWTLAVRQGEEAFLCRVGWGVALGDSMCKKGLGQEGVGT